MSELKSWRHYLPHWDFDIRLPSSLLPYVGDLPQSTADVDYVLQIESEKKVELHVHMEAAVCEAFYEKLNARRQLYLTNQMPAKRGPFTSLENFIKAWIDNTKLFDTEQIYTDLALAFAESRAKQNIVYSEVHVSPVDFTLMRKRFGFAEPLDLKSCLVALLKGLKAAERAFPGVVVRLIFDCLWITDDVEKEEILKVLNEVHRQDVWCDSTGSAFVVALGMGGPEVNRGQCDLKKFVTNARALGFALDFHSGEAVSAEEHQRNIELVNPDRVGHGFSAYKENWFFSGHISACPLSNILTGSFVGDLSEHPVKQMHALGKSFSINSDDPLLFSNPLSLEYLALKKALNWGFDMFQETQASARAAVFDRNGLRRALF